jgi:RimJ/RimL family protein N-acetyltransferase
MNLLFGHDDTVLDWASKKFGYKFQYVNSAIGVIDRDGLLIGAAVFQASNGTNVEFSYFGPGSLTLGITRKLISFAFNQMKVCRVTAKTPRRNRTVNRALPRFGFKMEGVMKHYYGPKKRLDAIVFGLLEADARRIIGEKK